MMREKFWKRYQMAEQSNDRGKYESCSNRNGVQLSEADTFIEFCFEQKCGQMKNGMDVLNEWRYHKSQYSKITDTTIYDFQHFSRHDASHSISILEAIELVVGEERIVKLSRGDLWLLLESAYSHDLGMALTGEDMRELWGKKEFKEYLLDCLNRRGVEQQRAAGYYKQIDNAIREKPQMEGMEGNGLEAISFEEYWPVEIANYVEWLVCDYIRRQHGERNQRIRKRIVTLEDSVIPYRLYECVTKIAALHTEDYDKIFEELPREEKGIGAEMIYPRFAAAMLRLGDVLDTDNNRFSAYALEHMTEVPSTSLLHLGKHKAVNMIQISTKKIKVTARSNDLDVCKEASRWFALIDNEVQKLICNWNRIVPPGLKGCILRPSECIVYLGDKGNEVYKADYERHFEVNKQELVNLLIGSNIYDIKLDFIREYLQNAMDASKMQLWQDIQAGEYDEILMTYDDKKMISPYDLPKEIYDQYKVKLKVEMRSDDYDNVYIIIEDSGIGIEKECLSVVSNLGSGWKKRVRYGKNIPQMPKWLRPTGGFGIGIQSAFMATDRVQMKTKTREESRGRYIILENPDSGGLITTNDCSLQHNGTIVELQVPLDCFLKETFKSQYLELESVKYYEDDEGIFSAELIENHVVEVIKNYVKAVIPNSIIPIYVGAKGFRSDEIEFRGWRKKDDALFTQYLDIEWNGKKYMIRIINNKKISIWDYENQIYFEAEWVGKSVNKDGRIACYKNVRSTHEKVSGNDLYSKFNMFIDIMGFSAKEVLKIHRNEFSETFNCEKYVDEYIKLYLHIYDLAENGKLEAQGLVDTLGKDVGFQQFNIVMKEENELSITGAQLGETEKKLPIYRYRLTVSYDDETDDVQKRQEENADNNDTKEIIVEIDANGEIYEVQQKGELDIHKVRLQYTQEQVSLNEFFEDYKKIFIQGSDDAVLLLQQKEAKADAAMTRDSIYDWIIKNMIFQNAEIKIKDDAEDSQDIMIPLIKKGYYKIMPELIPAIIAKMQIKGQYYTIFSGYDAPELKRGIAKVTLAKNDEITKEGEKKFYEDSFNGVLGQAVFSGNRYADKYKELYVSHIPYGVKEKGNPPYLISPITKSAREMIVKNEYLYKMKGYALNPDDFIELVTKTDNFAFLVSWVVKHAENKSYRNSREQVIERYKEYLRDMHAALSSKFGYENSYSSK